MSDHFISDELYNELFKMPDSILTQTATYLRKQWIRSPDDGDAFMGFMVCSEVLEARKLKLPPYPNERALARAMKIAAEKLNKP